LGPYSPAIRTGDLVFVSGQVGVDPQTGEPAGERFGEQCRQVFANLDSVLRGAGSSLSSVVSVTAVVSDVGSFGEFNDLFAENFPVEPPARITMQGALPRGFLVSIGCVASV